MSMTLKQRRRRRRRDGKIMPSPRIRRCNLHSAKAYVSELRSDLEPQPRKRTGNFTPGGPSWPRDSWR